MAVLIDPPAWPAHGRLWSHLVSDTSLPELHVFARRVGLPERAFGGDHYDVPQERYDDLVAAGAEPVGGRELLRRLVHSGLRVPSLRSERVLSSGEDDRWGPQAGPHRVDVLASPRDLPDDVTIGGWVVVRDAARRLLVTRASGREWGLPGTVRRPGEHATASVARAMARQSGLDVDPGELRPVGYQRLRLLGPAPAGWPFPAPWSYQALYCLDLAAGAAVRPAPGAEARLLDVGDARDVVGHRRWWPLAEELLQG